MKETTRHTLLETARRAHPALVTDEAAFVSWVEGRYVSEDPLDAHLPDVVLALACERGLPRALELFERELGPVVAGALTRFRVSSALADDLGQRVRERLFVARGETRPKIAEYSGKSSLSAWVRAVTARVAIDELRKARRPEEPGRRDADEELADAAGIDDPDLRVLLETYGDGFKAAFQAALAALPERDRLLLRLSVVDGMGVDAIGALHGVHKATAARWIAKAREDLADGTRTRLGERFRLSRTELESITRLCRSQVDVSLVRLLRKSP